MSEWRRNRIAQIKQRLFGAGFAVGVAAFWLWLLTQGTEYIWYAPLAIPMIGGGLWLMITDNNYFIEDEEKGEEDGRA